MNEQRMKPTKAILGAILLICAALLAAACGGDGGEASDPARSNGNVVELTAAAAKPVVTHYADGVAASYAATIASASKLRTAAADFTADPSEATLQATKDQWLAARDDYGPTEAFRFYDGPIDEPANGPEGRINAWPMDEAYVDYVEGDPSAGIINNPQAFPEITEKVLTEANEDGGETNISTGWHAIEFLLWGQDFADNGPGERPVTDYTTAAHSDRRATYLNLLSELLVADLTSVAAAWDPDVKDNYRTAFLADPVKSVGYMFRGIGALTVGELASQRIAVAIETADQEDEHSCFSDNTNADLRNNALGVQWVYLGTYPGTSGPGLDTLVQEADADLNEKLTLQIEASVKLTQAYPTTFDQMIVLDPEPLELTVKALEVQGELIARAASSLGLNVELGV